MDILLVLLIIVMTTSSVFPQGLSLKLPQLTTPNLQIDPTATPTVIYVDTAGQYYLDHEQNAATLVSPEALTTAIKKQSAVSQAQWTVWIKADQNVTYDKIVTLMALLQKAGTQQIGLVTDFSKDT